MNILKIMTPRSNRGGAKTPTNNNDALSPGGGSRVQSRRIDKANSKDHKLDASRTKLLMVGADGAGKSTLIRQWKLYQDPSGMDHSPDAPIPQASLVYYQQQQAAGNEESKQSDSERALLSPLLASATSATATTTTSSSSSSSKALYRDMVYHTLMSEAKTLAAKVPEKRKSVKSVQSLEQPDKHALEEFWGDEVVKQVWMDRFSAKRDTNTESLGYYMQHLDRVLDKEYVPTIEDVMRANEFHAKSIEQHDFHLRDEDLPVSLVDVGPFSKGRAKQIKQVFDNVTSVLFVIPIADFNLESKPVEDTLGWIADLQRQFPSSVSFIMLYNKIDVLDMKISLGRLRLEDYYSDYSSETFKDPKDYFSQKFRAAIKAADPNQEKKTRQVYEFFSNATSVADCEKVFEAVQDTLLKEDLRSSGFMM